MATAVREVYSQCERRDRAQQVVIIIHIERYAAGNIGYRLVKRQISHVNRGIRRGRIDSKRLPTCGD